MNHRQLSRRAALASIAALAGSGGLIAAPAQTGEKPDAVSTFSADVTPPLGHPLLAGWRSAATVIEDRLAARGLVLWGAGKPIVVCAIDWCELRNDAYDRWREALAEAVGTSRQRVLVHCVHQHDTPYVDLEAQRLLDAHGYADIMFSPEFHEQAVGRVTAAAKKSADSKQPVTHLGTGLAKVDRIACNRRVQRDGKVRFNRYSFTRDVRVRDADEGEIDPMLKMLSFFDGDRAVASISCYATHPMSYYGRGGVSYDFTGMARERRQRDQPTVFQIYLTGCSGDLTAAKYNTGDDVGRAELADRLYRAMDAAWKSTKRVPLGEIGFRVAALKFEPRRTGNHDPAVARRLLADPTSSVQTRTQAALTLSWQKRVASGQPIDVPAIDFGVAQLVLMPAETFVAYQLAAQRMKPGGFVMTPGFGECAPGYIPTDQAEREGFVEEHGYDWVAPMPEEKMLAVLREVLAD